MFIKYIFNAMLPNRIFFTGVPGSRWSGIAQTLEQLDGFNTSDRTPARSYNHNQYSGHKGAYFGTGMELEAYLDERYIDYAWAEQGGTRIVKSHDWAYKLDLVRQQFPNDWIMLVYRPDMASYAWWHEAGGFSIKYPSYAAYKDSTTMLGEIAKQNTAILQFAHDHNLTWNYFTQEWIAEQFGQEIDMTKTYPDILVTILK
jgi:hypothetical protein